MNDVLGLFTVLLFSLLLPGIFRSASEESSDTSTTSAAMSAGTAQYRYAIAFARIRP
jgi:hypothetical protein